eukprot:Hpha_TRINITY_DN16702_c5_g2::TRINITY_DN16702_c5_g2_i4::g.76553::m.76553
MDKAYAVLDAAARKGNIELVANLHEVRDRLHLPDSDFSLACLRAAEGGHVELVEFLLAERVADVNDTEAGQTLLHRAVRSGCSRTVYGILERGADVDRRGGYYHTPLTLAANLCHYEVLRTLVKRGAQLNLGDREGKTALWHSAYQNDLRTVRFLIRKGVDVHDSLPLCAASGGSRYRRGRDQVEVLKLLLKSGVDVNASGASGPTPLMNAAFDDQVSCFRTLPCFRTLLDAGADVNKSNEDGMAPVHIVATSGRAEKILLLAKYGADLGKRDNEGRTPCLLAAMRSNLEVLTA